MHIVQKIRCSLPPVASDNHLQGPGSQAGLRPGAYLGGPHGHRAASIHRIMLRTSTPSRSVASYETRRSERRSGCRYPLTLPVRYRIFGRDRAQRSGFGTTIDVSSRGVLFETEGSIPASGSIELAMKWPFRLGNSCYLQLIMRGHVVRSDDRKIAVHSEFHEFRTAGRSSFDKLPTLELPAPTQRTRKAGG